MDVSQHPITFPYGATTWPYSKAHPHLGCDRKCDKRTPLLVNGYLLGYTGNTGKSTDPHHHLQKVENGRVVDPGTGGFTIPTPAVVFAVGERADIGKYIRIRDAQGVEWSHFHLDEILAKKGQQIGADMFDFNEGDAENIYFAMYHKKPTKKEKQDFVQWAKNNKEMFLYQTVIRRYNDMHTTIQNAVRARDLSLKAADNAEKRVAELQEQLEAHTDPDAGKWRKLKALLKELFN